MNCFRILLLAAALFGAVESRAAATRDFPTNAPARVELSDQYETAQVLAYPGTNVTLLAIADRGGSEQIAGWIEALKPDFANRISIRGLANFGGVPGFLREKVRKKFRASGSYPVMLDWSGKTCQQFGYTPDVANLLIIDHRGVIRARLSGAVNTSGLAAARRALEASLATAADAARQK